MALSLSDPARCLGPRACDDPAPATAPDDLLNHFVAVQLQIDNIVSALHAGRVGLAGELAQAVKAQMAGVAIPRLAETLRRTGWQAPSGGSGGASPRLSGRPERFPDW